MRLVSRRERNREPRRNQGDLAWFEPNRCLHGCPDVHTCSAGRLVCWEWNVLAAGYVLDSDRNMRLHVHILPHPARLTKLTEAIP